jgi:hypothetical protein
MSYSRKISRFTSILSSLSHVVTFISGNHRAGLLFMIYHLLAVSSLARVQTARTSYNQRNTRYHMLYRIVGVQVRSDAQYRLL